MSPTPIWLLDFDGVINALSRRGGRAFWPDWRSARIDHPHRETNAKGNIIRLPLLWSDTVIATVDDAVTAGVDVRWLSTCRGDTERLLEVIPGLPELPWLDESILDDATARDLDPDRRMFSGPWKVEVAKAYVPDDAPLLWTEDEFTVDVMSESWRRARKAPTTFLRPHLMQGLVKKHVTEIREWIDDYAPYRGGAAERSIGTSVYEGIAEDIDTPIIRGSEPLVIEDVEDGFAR